MEIHFMSFGRENRIIPGNETTLVFNAANLPNPPHSLRKKHDGRNKDLQKEFFKDKRVLAFYDKIVQETLELIKNQTPDVTLEYITIAIGCHSGRHRSVALVEKLFKDDSFSSYKVRKIHKDL